MQMHAGIRRTNLEDMKRAESVLMELSSQGVSAGGVSAGAKAAPKARTPGEAGWRRLPGGGAAFVTSSGKRLSGKTAFAAASRQRKS